MTQEQILQEVRDLVHRQFSGEGTGHDYFHLARVVKTALKIARQENADLFLTELAAWLHDVGDYKLNDGIDKSDEKIREILQKMQIPEDIVTRVTVIVSQVSFSKGKTAESIEAQVVQDADRLDALGAIGIARTFAYGGSRHREIYNPDKPQETSVQHFYDKLFKLKSLMNTATGKMMATERHRYMEDFLSRFYNECNGLS